MLYWSHSRGEQQKAPYKSKIRPSGQPEMTRKIKFKFEKE